MKSITKTAPRVGVKKITYDKTQYFTFKFEFPYSSEVVRYCQFLKNSYGWKAINFNMGAWRFNDPALAAMLELRFPDVIVFDEVRRMISQADKNKKEEIEIQAKAEVIKNSFESNLDTTGIKGEPYPYQKVGMEFFLNNKGRAILSDDMGTGKTLQSLGYAHLAGHKRILVVCPASVKFAWEVEVAKWTSFKSFVMSSQTDPKSVPANTNVVIINYDILKKFIDSLKKVKWDCMVCDEAQYVKEKSSIRSKMVKELSRGIPSVIMLSGTPMMSRPIELYNILSIIDPYNWNNYYDYARRYCDGKMGYWGFEAKGATNLPELSKRISRYFLRRTKDQVLKFLPPKNRIFTPVELVGDASESYYKASESFSRFLKENKGKKDKEIAKSLQAEKLVKINYLREISAMGKLDAAKELIRNIIDAGEKVLVFSSFNAPLEELHDEFMDSVLILGSTDVEDRGPMVKKFQENPDVKVFLGGFLSAGTGITLTAASNVILLDYPYRPADTEQSIDRAHRPGSTAESINIYQLHSFNTIDDFMKKLLEKKQKIFDKVVNSQVCGEKGEIDVEELIEMLDQQNKEKKDEKKVRTM